MAFHGSPHPTYIPGTSFFCITSSSPPSSPKHSTERFQRTAAPNLNTDHIVLVEPPLLSSSIMSQTAIKAHFYGPSKEYECDALIDSGSPENTIHEGIAESGTATSAPNIGAVYRIKLSTDVNSTREFRFIEAPGVDPYPVVLGMNVWEFSSIPSFSPAILYYPQKSFRATIANIFSSG
jgi:hypothetical protein